jgi:cytochrome c peroxidase
MLALAAVVALAACRAGAGAGARPAAPTAAQPTASPPPWETANPVRPLPEVPLGSPADFSRVPWVTPEKARLGRWLFYDARLSADGAVSCATCHRPENAFSEPEPVSTGIHGAKGRRKSPPLVNVAFPVSPVWFWDGRARSLAEQAKGPIENPIEMGSTMSRAVETVAAIRGYRPYFREAFGDERVDASRLSEALAAYEATRLSGNSAYDRYAAGDANALSDEAIQGFRLFFGRAQCAQCHLGPGLSDARFHNLGVGYVRPRDLVTDPMTGFADRGRFEVTGNAADVGAFKTPTLRDVSKHAPYMHDGSLEDLWAAVLHYWRGGIPNPWLSERMTPVPLSRGDVAMLVAFLGSLDGEGYADVAPATFPP